jgi:hypothetical protein
MSESTAPTATELPVQKQLDAYNARDIDAFMAWWSDDCEYYEFPTRLLASGAAQIRERHVARFKEPNLFGKLIKRSVVDNLVVDQEIVTRSIKLSTERSRRHGSKWARRGSPRMPIIRRVEWPVSSASSVPSGSISAGATPARSDYPPKRERPDIPGVCLSVFQQLWDFSLSSAALFHLLDTVFTFSGTRHHRDALAKID